MSAKQQQQPQDSTDDLDGLDDVLDEFNNAGSSASSSKPPPAATSKAGEGSKPPSSSSNPAASGSTSVPEGAVPASLGNVTEDDDLLSEAFAAQFAASMEALMKDLGKDVPGGDGKGGLVEELKALGKGPGAGTGGGGEEDAKEMNEDELLKQFEKMLFASANPQSEGGLPNPAGPSSTATAGEASSSSSTGGKPANFQDAIAASMARLKASDASASTTAQSGNQDGMAAMLSALAAAGGGGGGDGANPDAAAAGLEELLKSLGNAAGGEGGGEGEEGLARMLENMMEELMSREVLQEPMKDMKNKYPEYFASDKFKTHPPSDQERYKKQYDLVCKIVAAFEDPAWDDADAGAGKTGPKAEAQKERRRKVQELMNEMQDCGAPPDEIVGELPPELEGMAGMGGAAGGEDCCVM